MNPRSSLVLRSDRCIIPSNQPQQSGSHTDKVGIGGTSTSPSTAPQSWDCSILLPCQSSSPESSSSPFSFDRHSQCSRPLNERPSTGTAIYQLQKPPDSNSSSISELSISEDEYQTGSSDSINIPERISWNPATVAVEGHSLALACMGSSLSRSAEVVEARTSSGYPLQPPEQSQGWSLALTTQPQRFHSATTHEDHVYKPQHYLEKAQSAYTTSTDQGAKPKVDSLAALQAAASPVAERSFSGLVVSESQPRLKSKTSTNLPQVQLHQPTLARSVTKRDNGTEKVSATGAAAADQLHPLESLERSVPHKVTLNLWLEEERSLVSRIEKKEGLCMNDERDVYLILGLNFLFQAIIVSGTAQASALDCHSSWVPLIMSLIVSIATFLAALRKLGEREEILCQLQACRTDARVLLQYIEKLRSLGDMFDLTDLPQLTSTLTKARRNCFPGKLNIICSVKFFVLLILFLFSVITFVSFRRILCHR